MKKLLAVTILAVAGLSVLAFLQLRGSPKDTVLQEDSIENNMNSIVPFSYEVAAEEILPTNSLKAPVGDMTIRSAEKLSLSDVDGIGPLVNGKLVYFRETGTPVYFTNSIESGKNYYFETEVRLFSCTDGEDRKLSTITPMPDMMMYAAGLDRTNAYVLYVPAVAVDASLASDKAAYNFAADSGISAEEAEIATEAAAAQPAVPSAKGNILLRINVNTGEVTEYRLPVGNSDIVEIAPLGDKNILIHSYIYPMNGEETGFDDLLTIENIDILDLSAGTVRNLYSNDNFGNPLEENEVEINYVSASEDKVYFSTKTLQDGMIIYGFRVYDADMNFIDGKDVASLTQAEAISAIAEMGVSNANIYYKVNRDTDDGSQQYYKYSPSTAGYSQVAFQNDSGNYEYNQMTLYSANPRNSAEVDYTFCQGTDEIGKSYIYLSNTIQNSFYQLDIDVDGFISPKLANSFYPLTSDYSGDFLLLSGGADYYNDYGYKKPFTFYYVPAEEINRALYGK